jgi:CheY-like chemotaxis protein
MPASCRVLVVEDEAVILLFVEDVLSAAGCDVTAVSTGEDALSEAQAHPPDLVVLDLHLPGPLTGLAILQGLRALSPRPLPAVITTASDVTAEQQRAFDQAGGGPRVPVLTKPFAPTDLVAEVLRSLSRDV